MSAKPRIGLLLDDQPSNGGSFHYARHIAQALIKLSGVYEVQAIATNDHWQDLAEQLPLGTLRYPRLAPLITALRTAGATRLARSLLGRQTEVYRVCRALACDLWLVPGQSWMAYGLGLRAITPIHDLMHLHEARFREAGSFKERLRRNQHLKACTGHCAAILVDSEIGRRHVLEQHPHPKADLAVLPFCHPDIDAAPTPTVPGRFFFYPANYWRHKNHEVILRAVARLRASAPDVQVHFSGALKEHHASIVALADRLGVAPNIRHLGYLPYAEVIRHYQQSLALIMPTYFGPTNIPPLEAAAVDCPILISDIYGHREQLGDAAEYFPPDDAAKLAQLLLEAWTRPAWRASKSEARTRLARRTSHDQFTANLRAIIDQTLSR